MHQFPIFVNLQGRTVVLVGTGPAAKAKARLIERAGGRIVTEWAVDATIAFVALDDEVEARTVAAALRTHGLLVNVVDRPELCDFTTPAIIDRSPVTIAIGTGGASAGLAKALRQRIEALLPSRLGALALALFGAREVLRARHPAAADRRRAIDEALAAGGVLDPLDPGAADQMVNWLANDTAARSSNSSLIAIRLRSTDPDDLSLREARLLGEADHIYHSPKVPPAILTRSRADAERHAVAAPPEVPAPGLALWLDLKA